MKTGGTVSDGGQRGWGWGGQRTSASQGGTFTSIRPESRRHPEIRAGTGPAQTNRADI